MIVCLFSFNSFFERSKICFSDWTTQLDLFSLQRKRNGKQQQSRLQRIHEKSFVRQCKFYLDFVFICETNERNLLNGNVLLIFQKGQIVKYRFTFNDVTKPVNSMFVGTLPELDMALFTICFEMDRRHCQVSLHGNKLAIRAFPFYYDGKRLIGATYPVI